MIKQAKLEIKGIFPEDARPAAIPAILASAMPTLKKRSGNAFAKESVFVDLERSPSKTTIFECVLPNSASAFPYESRVAGPNFFSSAMFTYLFLLILSKHAQLLLWWVPHRGNDYYVP